MSNFVLFVNGQGTPVCGIKTFVRKEMLLDFVKSTMESLGFRTAIIMKQASTRNDPYSTTCFIPDAKIVFDGEMDPGMDVSEVQITEDTYKMMP